MLFLDRRLRIIMSLDVVLVNWEGEALMVVHDCYDLLKQVVDLSLENIQDFRIIKYIDFDDDSTFNSFMIEDLLIDLEKLLEEAFPLDDPMKVLVYQLKEMCVKALEKPHQYIKVYGC